MRHGRTLGAMPAVVEALDSVKELPVEPGREAVARFRVRNTGNDVNNFTFRILGEPGRWGDSGIRVVGDSAGEHKITGKPADALPELDLLPNAKGDVEVTFRPPPSSDTPPGLVPYELLVCSHIAGNDEREEQVEAVQDGLLDVATFRNRDAQLLPRTSRGRFRGRHRLAVDNKGNSAATATFEAEDAENFLDVRFRPRKLVVEPGTAAFTKVRVRPRRLFLLGPPRAAPFKISVTFTSDAADDAPVPDGQIPPVDGLYMQRGVVPPLLLPLGVLVAAAVILWAIFRPQAQGTAAQLDPAQQAAATQAIANKANDIAAQSNALTRRAIKTAHADAVQARKQAAQAAAATRKQSAHAASTARKDAGKALQAATPSFTGTPYAQRVVQPFTAQPFPAHAFYVTDVVLGNPGGGKGTVTLTLGGAPVLVEPLTGVNAAAVKLSTPLLVQRDQTLAVHTSCTQDPCTPSVFVSGFAPAKPPDSTGARGAPSWKRLSPSCSPRPACATLAVPPKARSFELTDVVFQNPAGDTGTITLSRGGRPLLVEGLDPSRAGDLALSFAAPIVLRPREKLTLTVGCRVRSGACTAGALLVGVLRLAPAAR
jgi:hypothetical protein